MPVSTLYWIMTFTSEYLQSVHGVTDFVSRDSLKSKNKNRDSREPTDMIKFSKVPFIYLKQFSTLSYMCLCVAVFYIAFFLCDFHLLDSSD